MSVSTRPYMLMHCFGNDIVCILIKPYKSVSLHHALLVPLKLKY